LFFKSCTKERILKSDYSGLKIKDTISKNDIDDIRLNLLTIEKTKTLHKIFFVKGFS